MRVTRDGLEDGTCVGRRSRDHAEDIRRSGLLLQRFAQLGEQPGVFHRDDGLGGEALDEADLLVGERADLLAVDGDHAEEGAFLAQRHVEDRPRTAQVDDGAAVGIAPPIDVAVGHVGEMDVFLAGDQAVGGGVRPIVWRTG